MRAASTVFGERLRADSSPIPRRSSGTGVPMAGNTNAHVLPVSAPGHRMVSWSSVDCCRWLHEPQHEAIARASPLTRGSWGVVPVPRVIGVAQELRLVREEEA